MTQHSRSSHQTLQTWGMGRGMEITYSAGSRDNFTVKPTDSYTLHKETELWRTGQCSSCPFFLFLPEATKPVNLLQFQGWLFHASSTGSMFSVPEVTRSRWQLMQTTMQDFPNLGYSLVSWFYSQQRKSFSNIGKALGEIRVAGTTHSSPVPNPSQKPLAVGQPTGFIGLWRKASVQRDDGDEVSEAWR